MKPFSSLIFVIFLFFSVACEKEEEEFIWISIAETQCANAWDSLDGNSAEDKVTQYLSSENIPVYELEIEDLLDDDYAVCLACFCSSGRVIYVLIEEADIRRAVKLGFSIRSCD